jgi:hypothetical protein
LTRAPRCRILGSPGEGPSDDRNARPLLLAAAAPSAADRNEIEQQVVGIYAPMRGRQRKRRRGTIRSTRPTLTALIARWNAVKPKGELDGMFEADWLCLCQDWEPDSFQATIKSVAMTDADTAEVELTLDLGFGARTASRASV